jgi:glyoxylase-like metal-dependent hydrolase (beta-lactamase superfamily II)
MLRRVKPWIRNTLIGLAVFTALLGGAYYWLLVENHIPSDARFPLDIAEVRKLASAMPGEKPTNIEVERIAAFEAPSAIVVAGDGWSKTELPAYSFRVVYPSTTAIIDTALDQSIGAGNLASFDAAAYARMQAAMAKASLIVVTHEHMDHIGGLMAYPKLAEILPAIRLTREQLAHPEASKPAAFPPHSLDDLKPLEYDAYLAVAPGIVLIKSPGHTPGSQLVFVQTASGAEYLFLGDVAWRSRNIELERERPRLVTAFLIHEDRTAVFGELVALHQLHAAEPHLQIVPGHDNDAITKLIADGALKSQFSPSANP